MSHASKQQLLDQANHYIVAQQWDEAVKVLYVGVKQYPEFYEAWLLFSRGLYEVGHIREAVQIVQHAEQLDPLQPDFQHIQQCMQRQALAEAEQRARQMLSHTANHPKACFTLASIALTQNQPDESIACLEPATKVHPANATLCHLLSTSYDKAGRFEDAIKEATRLVSLDNGPDPLWMLINLLLRYGQYLALLMRCDEAEKLLASNPQALSKLNVIRGQAYRILGKREQSIRCLQASLNANANNADAWWALADFKNYHFSNDEKAKLGGLVNSNVPAHIRCPATFAYAKLSEAENRPAESFALYKQANALKNTAGFTPLAIQKECENRIHTYRRQSLASQAPIDHQQPVPIFIVGLPRSGSTLIEQMLASHTQIEGTIEQPTLPAIERQAERLAAKQYGCNLSDALHQLKSDELASLGQAYLDNGRLFRTGERQFFTDKQPFNYRLVGLIHKILPQAKIIDVRRNPMDCGYSLYKQYFPHGVYFSYDLAHIADAFNAYEALMHHWDDVLPGKVLKVQYENLVVAPEDELKRILHYIGLPFEQSCLNFQYSGRAVHTASSEQVRQPINFNGIDRWKPVANELDDLKKRLNSLKMA